MSRNPIPAILKLQLLFRGQYFEASGSKLETAIPTTQEALERVGYIDASGLTSTNRDPDIFSSRSSPDLSETPPPPNPPDPKPYIPQAKP